MPVVHTSVWAGIAAPSSSVTRSLSTDATFRCRNTFTPARRRCASATRACDSWRPPSRRSPASMRCTDTSEAGTRG